jgi:signal peptide peptidase SppA
MTTKHTYPEMLWAGTQQSLTIAMEAHNTLMAASYVSSADQPAEEPVPYNFSNQGGVGIVAISGSLTNKDSPYNRYYGMTSYADIRRAMVYAAQQPDVNSILMYIESGGGAVSGVADTGDMIAAINKVKPVYAFTDGMMASAAYWLGSSAREVYNSRTALVGSIGVITTHMEASKAMKDQGLGVTVMRAGEFKALANPYEPLTTVGKEQVQAQLDSAYAVFIGHVADSRGVSVAAADSTMGQGREFMGADAVTAGLTDGVISFDKLHAKIQAKHIDSSAKKEQTTFNFQRGEQMKVALTEQQLAAIAAGAPAAAAAAVVPDPVAAAAALAADAAAAEAAAAALAASAAAPVAAAAAAPDAVVTMLQTQLREAQASVTALTVEKTGLAAKLASVEASHSALVKIAGASLSNMKVALGFSALDASAMSAESILVEHTATSALFNTKFTAGGVAAVVAPEDKEADAGPGQMHAARIAATRFTPNK